MPYGIKRLYVCVHKGHAAATSFTYLDNKTLEYTNVMPYSIFYAQVKILITKLILSLPAANFNFYMSLGLNYIKSIQTN